MVSTIMTNFMRKLKNKVDCNSETFQNDKENYNDSAGIPLGSFSPVTCNEEPSTFRMDNETNDKINRRESESDNSLLKFAIRFAKDNGSNSSSIKSVTCESNNHGQDEPMSEHSDGVTDGEYGESENNELTNNATDHLGSRDAIEADPSTQNISDEGGQTDNGNENYGDDKSEKSQSVPSSPQESNGVNCHNQRLRRRQVNGGRDHVVIEFEEGNGNEHFQTPSGHVESYLYIMQFLGICAFRRVEYRTLSVAVTIFLKALFWIVSAGAFLNSLKTLKRVAIEKTQPDKNLKDCVSIGFALIRCFSRFYFIKITGTQSHKLSVMLLHIRNPRLSTINRKFSFSRLATILAITTFILTTLKFILGYIYLDEWNWKDSIESRAFSLTKTFFVWSPDKNITDALEEDFLNSNSTPTHVLMGFFDGVLDFCGTLQGEAIRDLLILASVTILIDQTTIEKRIQPQLLIHPNNTDPAEVEESLRHFKCVNQESLAINGTLVTPFKFLTIQNILLYAYLFVQLIDYDGMTMPLMHAIVGAIKGLILFYIGMRLHWQNSNIKKWLHYMSSYKGPVDITDILGMSLECAISDFKDNPIGLGSDYFLINESFMVGLFAAVGSVISLLFEFDRFLVLIHRLLR